MAEHMAQHFAINMLKIVKMQHYSTSATLSPTVQFKLLGGMHQIISVIDQLE